MNMQKGSQHSGHHMPTATAKNIRALKITAWLTGVYFVIELGIGIYTGSIAVLSDSFHTFSAVGGVLLALEASLLLFLIPSQNNNLGNFYVIVSENRRIAKG
jgi:cobalt-zinc-cadmium efflux system protein